MVTKTARFDLDNVGDMVQHELFQKYQIDFDLHKKVFNYIESKGLDWFSTPSHRTDVDMLDELGVVAHKLGADDATNLPLIKYVSQTGKPMIISTGMADAEEIQEAIDTAQDSGCRELAILHCVSGYPAQEEDYNLRTLIDMQHQFGLVTGLSDHTIENTMAITSIAQVLP